MATPQSHLPRTSEAIAAAELRNAILTGALEAGAKIRQEATAQQLGISLIPVREALKTLAGEGIVTYRPQRGYFVTELPAGAVADVYVARDLVERRAEELAVARLTERDLTAMDLALRDQARAVDVQDAVAMITTNRRFHFAIFDRCDNPWLHRFVTQLWDTLDPYRVVSYRHMWLQDPERHVPAEILHEHERILEALKTDDHSRSLALLHHHRVRSETFLATLLGTEADQGLDGEA